MDEHERTIVRAVDRSKTNEERLDDHDNRLSSLERHQLVDRTRQDERHRMQARVQWVIGALASGLALYTAFREVIGHG